MLAFRAIVATNGQHPVPSSREHASASASSTRRSLPDVGEFAHTQFMTAILMLIASARASPPIQVLAQFLSHSPPYGAVHRRSAATYLCCSGTVAPEGGWSGTVLESVRCRSIMHGTACAADKEPVRRSSRLSPVRPRTGCAGTRFRWSGAYTSLCRPAVARHVPGRLAAESSARRIRQGFPAATTPAGM